MADLNVALILRLVDRATGPARAAMDRIDRMSRGAMSRNAARVDQGARMMASGLGTVAGVAAKGALAIAAYNGAVIGIGLAFVRPAAEMERFKVQLTNLEGSSQGAERAMAWIQDFATRTPLELNDTIAAYARLKAFGLDPTQGAMQALVDTMAATGGGAEQLDGLVLALGQAWTKGKLQGEEALQMLERGVPVWDLLGEKMGKSAAELQEMASKGKLGREEITLLIDALAERNKGASDAMSKTWDGIISNLTDQWSRWQMMVMDAGVFDFLKDKLQVLLDFLNAAAADGRLRDWAELTSAYIQRAFLDLDNLVTRAIGAWTALYPWLEAAAEWLGGWKELLIAITALAFGKTVLGLVVGIAKLTVGFARVARGAAGFLWILGRATMLNPIGLAIAAIATAVYAIYRNWAAVGPWFQRLWAKVRSYFEGMVDFVNGVFTLDFERAWSGIKQMWTGAIAFFRTILDGIAGVFSWAWNNAIAPVLDKLGLLDPIIAAWQAFQNAIGSVLDWIGARFDAAMARIRPVIDALKWVYEKGSDVVAAINGAGAATAETTGRVGSDRGAPISMRALGGPVRAGNMYEWQEEGRELFVPRTDGNVISNRQLKAMSAGSGRSGGRNINLGGITINAAPGMDPQAIARAVRREIERMTKSRGTLLHDGGSYA